MGGAALRRGGLAARPPRAAVIVPNWNGRRFLDACLTSLLAQTYPDREIVLVDNASTDGSVEHVRARYPGVRVVASPRNTGFAGALNLGIAATAGEFVATLNNDARAEPGWLAALVAAAERSPRIGSVAGKLLFANRPELVNSAGICLDRAAIAWDRLGGVRDDPADRRVVPVFGASGGAALYRRVMIEEVGGFDAAFFSYLEDVDLAWRARLRGWAAVYQPAARAYHLHSATAVEGSPFKSYHLARNKTWLVLKCWPSALLRRDLAWIAGYDLAFLLYALARRRDLAALYGRLDAWRELPRLLRERRRLQSARRISARAARRLLCPVEPPWCVLARYRHIPPARFPTQPAGDRSGRTSV